MLRRCVRPAEPVADEATALVAATSGSTGAPRGVVITRGNLVAAAEGAWAARDGLSECAWVLALPVTSIGGLGVLTRAHLSGTALHTLASVGGAGSFAVRDLVDITVQEPFAISLVPRQLQDILDSSEGTAWLARAHTVLVGGSATPTETQDRARAAGVALVTTYGMTETTGGCVYDGMPLPGVRIDIGDDGRIEVTGRQVAAGYREGDEGTPAGLFSGAPGGRTFRTADHGTWAEGRLQVTGRVDDVVTIQGVNVSLGAVESAVRSVPGVRECAVMAHRDERSGHRLIAYVVAPDPHVLSRIPTRVAERLGGLARPHVVSLESLPMLPNGKIDRRALHDPTT